jgi:hypothetical protein
MHKRLYRSFNHFSSLVHLSVQNFPVESFIVPWVGHTQGTMNWTPTELVCKHVTDTQRHGVSVKLLHGWGRAAATPRPVTRRTERVW